MWWSCYTTSNNAIFLLPLLGFHPGVNWRRDIAGSTRRLIQYADRPQGVRIKLSVEVQVRLQNLTSLPALLGRSNFFTALNPLGLTERDAACAGFHRPDIKRRGASSVGCACLSHTRAVLNEGGPRLPRKVGQKGLIRIISADGLQPNVLNFQ